MAEDNREEVETLRRNNTILLNACKMAYRKHALDALDIGWEELIKELSRALLGVMGDTAFDNWVDEVCPENTI